MLRWALIFLVVALVAGVLGFGGIAGASMGIAQVLFFVFLVRVVAVAHADERMSKTVLALVGGFDNTEGDDVIRVRVSFLVLPVHLSRRAGRGKA